MVYGLFIFFPYPLFYTNLLVRGKLGYTLNFTVLATLAVWKKHGAWQKTRRVCDYNGSISTATEWPQNGHRTARGKRTHTMKVDKQYYN